MALQDEILQHMNNSRSKLDSARTDQTNAINKLKLLIPQIAAKDATIAAQTAEIAAKAATIAAQETEIADLQAALDACEAGNTPPPPPPPPPPGEFWQGLNTVWPTAATTGPRIPVMDATAGNVSGLVKGLRFISTVIPANGTIFEDCEFVDAFIDGNPTDGDYRTYTVRYSRFTASGLLHAMVGLPTAEYCDISGFEDGVRIAGNGTWAVRRCYIHNLWAGGAEPHNDGIQAFNGNGVVEENYIDARDTSAVMVQSWDNSASTAPGNVIVRHNWLGGADLPLRIEAECLGKGCQAYENVIERGFYGYFDLDGADAHYGNIDSVTGDPID